MQVGPNIMLSSTPHIYYVQLCLFSVRDSLIEIDQMKVFESEFVGLCGDEEGIRSCPCFFRFVKRDVS